MTPSETDLAYIAGLIDADGCISGLMKRHSGIKRTAVVEVSIAMANEDLIRWVDRTMGVGHVRIVPPIGSRACAWPPACLEMELRDQGISVRASPCAPLFAREI